MRHYTVEEKREDDAAQAWLEYAKQQYWDMDGSVPARAKKAFIAGYLEGRKDGKIGV